MVEYAYKTVEDRLRGIYSRAVVKYPWISGGDDNLKVATWHGGTEFTIDEVADPAPGPEDVIVEVEAVGVCGTDVHITKGLFPSVPPKVLGHEFGGKIVAVGTSVDAARVGQDVACDITSHCFECVECLDGRWNRCERSTDSSGAFAQFAVVPSSSAVEIPATLGVEDAALTEPASCCLSGIEMCGLTGGESVLVIGGGAMGLFTMAFAKLAGAETVILSDPIPERRAMAMQLGADVVHDPGDSDISELVADLTNGRGVHLAAEAVGSPSLVRLALDQTRPRGTLLLIGVSPRGTRLPVDLYDFQWRETVIRGAFGRGTAYARTPTALADLNLDGFISHRHGLDGVADAIAATGSGIGVKTVIRPND